MSRIGVDVGVGRVLGLLTGTEGEVIDTRTVGLDAAGNPETIYSAVANLVREWQTDMSPGELQCIGVGVAAFVNPDSGAVLYGAELGIEDFPLRRRLEDDFGVPAYIDNDVNCGLLGEVNFGAARGFRDVVGLMVDAGIGSGIMCGGRLIRGAHGVGAEVGHLIFQPGGRQCLCGKRGCFEAYAGGRAIAERIQDVCQNGMDSRLCGLDEKNLLSVRQALMEGDSPARRIWDEAILALRVLVSNLVTLFDPELVLLSGQVIKGIPDIQNEIREYLVSHEMRGVLHRIHLKTSTLGTSGVALGATRLPEARTT